MANSTNGTKALEKAAVSVAAWIFAEGIRALLTLLAWLVVSLIIFVRALIKEPRSHLLWGALLVCALLWGVLVGGVEVGVLAPGLVGVPFVAREGIAGVLSRASVDLAAQVLSWLAVGSILLLGGAGQIVLLRQDDLLQPVRGRKQVLATSPNVLKRSWFAA